MKVMEYSRLAPAEMAFLADPENRELAGHWRLARASVSAMVGFCSWNYPRPLYYEGPEQEWADAAKHLEALRGTPVYERLADNIEVGREIWLEGVAHGHTDHLHEIADAFLDAARDDEMYLHYFPHEPPPRPQYGAR
ncbi:MAG TPA: hypothetical protein VGB24_03355 [Longimicrobium sp.]|jgi:hypothetical protein|uniref:hypothetical protein n=1 Tax=Longimicrobium sp. TaxID=2029185 RepID=UPI002ED7FAEA